MLLCRKQNVGINLWREGGLVFLLVTRPLTSSNSGIATHPLLAKASVIWIVLFREGDFKREGRLSWSQERRKAALAGSPTVFGPFFTTTERCQAPPHNCYACVLAQSFRERHFANVRYLFIYFFLGCYSWSRCLTLESGPTTEGMWATGSLSSVPRPWELVPKSKFFIYGVSQVLVPIGLFFFSNTLTVSP